MLSHVSNDIVNVGMWPKFSNPSIFIIEIIIELIYKNFTRKTSFFEGRSRFKFNNLRLILGSALQHSQKS